MIARSRMPPTYAVGDARSGATPEARTSGAPSGLGHARANPQAARLINDKRYFRVPAENEQLGLRVMSVPRLKVPAQRSPEDGACNNRRLTGKCPSKVPADAPRNKSETIATMSGPGRPGPLQWKPRKSRPRRFRSSSLERSGGSNTPRYAASSLNSVTNFAHNSD
jgi:hypothetical protein